MQEDGGALLQPVAVCPHLRVPVVLHVADGCATGAGLPRRPWPARATSSPLWTLRPALPRTTATKRSSPAPTKMIFSYG